MPWLIGIGLAAALLIGNARAGLFDPVVNGEYRKETVIVRWIETENIAQFCGPRALACAIPGDLCLIYTYPNPSFDSLGHEMLHCFKGRWHP